MNAQKKSWLITFVIIGLVVTLTVGLWSMMGRKSENAVNKEAAPDAAVTSVPASTSSVKLVEAVSTPPQAKLLVTGTVEANQQEMTQVSALASGRVESVLVALGDQVSKGKVLIRIESPQVAEMHGKLHEAETRLKLAKATLARVKEAANRVSILKARASLDEADATLKRVRQLVGEGLTARKDLIAAQSDYDRAKAEYNFQKDISLNREVTEAVANVQTSATESEHIKDSLKALDAQLPERGEGSEHEISTLELRSPMSGIVIERSVNPGAGVEAGKPLLTIANTSSLWVMANVPEKEMVRVKQGMAVRVLLEQSTTSGTVSFIDPRLNEDTRTSRVRVVIANPENKIQVGSFAQIELSGKAKSPPGAVYVPSASVQTIDDKTVVFVKEGSGFKPRAVKVGDETSETIPVLEGLSAGEKLAADGSFVLKSRLLKERLGDD